MPALSDRRELTFDRVADEYERTRPTYPPELLEQLPLDADAVVLDLGAGTGKLTRVLAGRYRNVTAVEPLVNMRKMLQQVVPGVIALPGSAERIPLDDGAVDGVFAAQAFHWFDKSVALPEIARVLRAGGIFAIVWNEGDDVSSFRNPRRRESCTCTASRRCGAGRTNRWQDLLRGSCFFAEVHDRVSVADDHVLDRAGILENLRSVSWIRPATIARPSWRDREHSCRKGR